MTEANSNSGPHFGFLRILEVDGGGYLGGMLVTNQIGRPLEFQCTTLVRPNRTQTILYGPTLAPFVYSELIGKTLYQRLDVKPHLIIVDQEALLPLRAHIPVPVGCLYDPASPARELPDETRLAAGRHSLQFSRDFAADREQVAAVASKLPGDADLSEPLERVCEALRESMRAGAVA